MSDIAIDDLLAEFGFRDGESRAAARTVLESARLTNPRKQRIATAKRDQVRDLLRATFVIACTRGACRTAAERSGRTTITASLAADCEICGGSANKTEIDRAISAVHGAGLHRIVIVGGSPSTQREIADLVAGRIELRLVSGSDRRNARDAKRDLEWADVVVIWGATELDHKVSQLYTSTRDDRVITCPRRGIAALATTLVDHVASRR